MKDSECHLKVNPACSPACTHHVSKWFSQCDLSIYLFIYLLCKM